jgi:hypothetical protein
MNRSVNPATKKRAGIPQRLAAKQSSPPEALL